MRALIERIAVLLIAQCRDGIGNGLRAGQD